MKSKHTFRLSPEVARQLADFAVRKRVSQAELVEAALTSFLIPDEPQRIDIVFGKRFDRMTRQIESLRHDIEVGNEAMALFVRHWLTANPPLPESALAGAQAQGRERFEAFVHALARRLEGQDRLSAGPALE